MVGMSKCPRLALYYFESCPYCQKVLKVIHKNLLDVELRDVQEEKVHLERLVKDTGRRTVPCLYIDDQPMHESNEIIGWLEANLHQLTQKK